ncbi:MAG: hemerythrin family protein [Magnetococcales bacterium]|nr:hemerythrin family protein [Magnetococcales bacterium]
MSNLTVSDVGVERFNKDHQRLLFYIEEFTRLSARFRLRTPFPDEWDQMDGIFVRLEKYTRVHFKEEEQAMAKRGYPTLPDHHAQHQQLINVLADLRIKVKRREFQAIGAVKLFLQEWITNHINHTDTQYGPYFKTETSRLSPPGPSELLHRSNSI